MAAPTFDAASSSSASADFSWSHTCTGSNRYLLVGISWKDDVNITSVTYNSVTMTSLGKKSTTSGSTFVIEMFGLKDPATGANTVSVDFASNPTNAVGGAVSVTDINQTTQTGVFASGGADSPAGHTESVSVASTVDDLVIDTNSSFSFCFCITFNLTKCFYKSFCKY